MAQALAPGRGLRYATSRSDGLKTLQDNMVARLSREEMISFMESVLSPAQNSSEREVDSQLLALCMNSPDPAGAMDIIIETPEPITAEELVQRILSLAPRDPNVLPGSELDIAHPLRWMKLDPP